MEENMKIGDKIVLNEEKQEEKTQSILSTSIQVI